jgi:hypothetical protein
METIQRALKGAWSARTEKNKKRRFSGKKKKKKKEEIKCAWWGGGRKMPRSNKRILCRA